MPKPRLTKLRGKKLFGMILRKIKRNPKCWDQSETPTTTCGTAFCILGHIVVAAKGLRFARNVWSTEYEARKLLKLSVGESWHVFASNRTLPELKAFYEKMKD